jgi:hypothetical protein
MVQDVGVITGERRILKQIPRVVPRWLFDWVNKVYTQQAARHASPQFLADRYDRATANILKTLESVGDNDFAKSANYPGWDPLLSGKVTLEQLFGYVAAHFRVHEQQIRRALQSGPGRLPLRVEEGALRPPAQAR